MSLVYAGVLSHAPGITGRAHLVDNVAKRDEFMRTWRSSGRKSKQPALRRL